MSKVLFVEVEDFERKLLEERCGAFNSVEAITRIAETTVENIARFFEGHPQNIISY